jgi:hypothetical protein
MTYLLAGKTHKTYSKMKKQIQKKNWLLETIKVLNGFQTHLGIFIIVNAGLWLIWLLTAEMNIYSWPIYFTVIWGIVLFLHFALAEKIFNSGNKNPD